MSLTARDTRKLALAGLAAAAALGASASAAQAATLNLKYSCTYPLIGAQPLAVSITATVPSTAKVGTATPTFAVKATAVASGDTYDGLKLVGAKTVEGKANAVATITAPQGKLTVPVPTTVAKYTVPATKQDLKLTAAGTAPSVKFTKAGSATINVTSLKLNLIARNSSGKAIQLPPVSTDSDGNKDTFDVACTLSPTSQSTKLATIAIS